MICAGKLGLYPIKRIVIMQEKTEKILLQTSIDVSIWGFALQNVGF